MVHRSRQGIFLGMTRRLGRREVQERRGPARHGRRRARRHERRRIRPGLERRGSGCVAVLADLRRGTARRVAGPTWSARRRGRRDAFSRRPRPLGIGRRLVVRIRLAHLGIELGQGIVDAFSSAPRPIRHVDVGDGRARTHRRRGSARRHVVRRRRRRRRLGLRTLLLRGRRRRGRRRRGGARRFEVRRGRLEGRGRLDLRLSRGRSAARTTATHGRRTRIATKRRSDTRRVDGRRGRRRLFLDPLRREGRSVRSRQARRRPVVLQHDLARPHGRWRRQSGRGTFPCALRRGHATVTQGVRHRLPADADALQRVFEAPHMRALSPRRQFVLRTLALELQHPRLQLADSSMR